MDYWVMTRIVDRSGLYFEKVFERFNDVQRAYRSNFYADSES